jgi:hypothetical protein
VSGLNGPPPAATLAGVTPRMLREVNALLLLLLPAAAGCVGEGRVQLDHYLDGWVGVSSDRLIETLGAPGGDARLSNGDRMLTWQTSAPNDAACCTLDFRVDAAGNIAHYAYKGQVWECQQFLYQRALQ